MGITSNVSDEVDVIEASGRFQPMTIKDILDWLRKSLDGRSFAKADDLGHHLNVKKPFPLVASCFPRYAKTGFPFFGGFFYFFVTSRIISASGGGMAIFQTVISDLRRAEQQLQRQLESVRAAIAAIAGSTSPRKGPKRRGRRRMSAAQRRAVSIRMRAYWKARRKASK